jgi:pimeloyl-ACP methyl ester carboxylesterase
MGKRRFILFTGLGGDHRLFGSIRIPDVEMLTPDYIEPISGESLSAYARRISSDLRIQSDDIVGGASFGGMIAAEIAQQQPVAALVLLGSCIHPEKLPWLYRWMERLSPLIPDFLLWFRSWRPLVRWRFYPLTPEAETCMIEMAADCPRHHLRAFGAMVMGWGGAKNLDCPVLSINADKDRIIPPACSEPGITLKDAGHSFTLTHGKETRSAIEEFLRANNALEPSGAKKSGVRSDQ